jgi:hypothetical protein
MQLESFCGYNADLIAHARKHFGNKPGGMPPRAVRAWYERNAESIPDHLRGRSFGTSADDLQVCHIIAKALGGRDWPYNYIIATARVNRYFSSYVDKDWTSYVGKDVMSASQTFARWATLREQTTFGQFDPVADYRLAR